MHNLLQQPGARLSKNRGLAPWLPGSIIVQHCQKPCVGFGIEIL